ncbi:hypothetical protein D3C81_2232040 [compost metagenome]
MQLSHYIFVNPLRGHKRGAGIDPRNLHPVGFTGHDAGLNGEGIAEAAFLEKPGNLGVEHTIRISISICLGPETLQLR